MQTIIQRSIWGLIWIATIAIAVWLSSDMTQDQPILFAILLVCLAVISVSLVYGRSLWASGAKGSAIAAFGVGGLCLCVAVVSEISYWSGSIEGVHEQIASAKAKARGKDLVQEKRRQQLAGHVGGLSPAEIQAQMEGELTRVYRGATLAASTLSCTDEASANYRHCGSYLDLKARLASAQELRDLEGKVLADSTEVVSTSIRRSFYEAARIGSDLIGGDVRTWIAGIVGLLVATMMSLHLLSLYIGFAPTRRLERAAAAKASPATPIAPHPFAPVLRRAATSETAFQRPPEGSPSPVPVPGPSPKPLIEAAPVAEEPEEPIISKVPPRLVINNEVVTKSERRAIKKKGRTTEGQKATERDIQTWRATHMRPDEAAVKPILSQEAYENFESYCADIGKSPMHIRRFSGLLRKSLGLPRTRGGQGTRFVGYTLRDPEAMRASA